MLSSRFPCAIEIGIKLFPFLGYYCQRGDSFKPDHCCRIMTYEAHATYYNNATIE